MNNTIAVTPVPAARGEFNAPTPRAEAKRVLVVDDDAAVRHMLSRVLAGEGYEARTAATGAEALEIASAERVDLALLDLSLPGQSGWETLRRLAAMRPVPAVIIITARPNQLFPALGAGVGALLEKPLDFPTMLETAKRLLAEPEDTRLARLAGQSLDFYHNLPRPRKPE